MDIILCVADTDFIFVIDTISLSFLNQPFSSQVLYILKSILLYSRPLGRIHEVMNDYFNHSLIEHCVTLGISQEPVLTNHPCPSRGLRLSLQEKVPFQACEGLDLCTDFLRSFTPNWIERIYLQPKSKQLLSAVLEILSLLPCPPLKDSHFLGRQ